MTDGQSLLQKAFLRSASLSDVAGILTVTNTDLYFKAEDDFAEVNTSRLPTTYILEPFGRNTAAAVASAALDVEARYGQDALLLVLPADHLVADLAAFATAVDTAAALARQGKLVTFGVRPDSPETGYGYIEAQGNIVQRFVEKPSLEVARGYVESGRFYWNSGMFCFTAGTLLREMSLHCLDVLESVRTCLSMSVPAQDKRPMRIHLDRGTFAVVPDISIDYAVMERSAAVAVVPCDIGWSDIGSWSAMWGVRAADADGNVVEGDVLLHDARKCYVRATDGKRLVGVVGAENLVIVDTPDALLVADKSRSQDVKALYTTLKQGGHDAHKLHRTVNRPWGTYSILEQGDHFKVKQIVVKPGASLSLQMHHHRSEHWIVVRGCARVINGDKELFVSTNESTYIPAGHVHRLTNPGVIDLVMIEVQSGEYLEEDDIVRMDDVYGRCP